MLEQAEIKDVAAYLAAHERKSLLRFITCGSVDDGKSTLIGRLLFDSKLIFEDQLATLEVDSKKSGTQGENIDLALLVDGLAAEREQGITIDVAYRFFATDARKYIVADTPGHEQYTRNMATGASTAEVAILLIDARHGVLTQTKRHAFITATLGIRHVVLAVNKMDLVDWRQSTFNDIVGAFDDFRSRLGHELDVTGIPMSALLGDNVATGSKNTPWYDGPTLVDYLDTVEVDRAHTEAPFRMPVQWVNRPSHDFRGFSGQVASGVIRPGDSIKVLPSAKESRVERITTMDGDLSVAQAGQSVTLTLSDEIDCSRGDVIAQAGTPAQVSDQFQVRILWMSDKPLFPGRMYRMKIGAKQVNATINAPKYGIDINTLSHQPQRTLELNEFAVCTVSLDSPVAFDPYDEIRETGGFIIIDRFSNDTVGMGLIDFALRRASNIHWQALDVSRDLLAEQKGQKASVLWFTGLSGAGKSTIANALQKKLFAMGKHTFVLDGDNVRHGLCRDLGFTAADRVENIRRVANVAKLMVDAGLITLASFISPFRSERDMARKLIPAGEFVEIYVDTPLAVAEERDPKGLYKKARAGQLKNFTGIDSEYQAPENPEIRVNTVDISPDDAADQIIQWLIENEHLPEK